MNEKPKIVVLVGPTASGKSDFAIDIARKFDGEIINADSMQVYKYMDIGTAKPTLEEREHIKHHMIDLVKPDKDFNVGVYVRGAKKVIEKLFKSNKHIVVVGGTGLYIKALLRGLVDVHIRLEVNRDSFQWKSSTALQFLLQIQTNNRLL